jgi:hypothetical protein
MRKPLVKTVNPVKDVFLKQHNSVELWQLTTGLYGVYFKGELLGTPIVDRAVAVDYYEKTVLEQIL